MQTMPVDSSGIRPVVIVLGRTTIADVDKKVTSIQTFVSFRYISLDTILFQLKIIISGEKTLYELWFLERLRHMYQLSLKSGEGWNKPKEKSKNDPQETMTLHIPE